MLSIFLEFILIFHFMGTKINQQINSLKKKDNNYQNIENKKI